MTVDALALERRARLAAERMLVTRQGELSAANAELSKHALSLTDEIIEQREQVADIRGQNTQVKQDLEQAHNDVDIAKRRLWNSLETVRDGFAVFDRDDRMIAANTAYLSIFDGLESIAPGVAYRDVIRAMADEGIVDTDGLTRADWCAAQHTRWHSRDLPEKTIKLWNGKFIKLVDRRSENGDTVSMALNITDAVLRERQLDDARQKAEAATRAKSAFLAKMSHELRTPMNGVVGMADLLVDTPLDDEQKLFVDTIKTSGEALLDLINDVLDYSRMEAARLVLHSDDFDLEQMLGEVLALFQRTVMDRNLELIVDYDMDIPTIFIGDPGRVRQILTNLIGNAVKFTPMGHVLIKVAARPETGGDFLLQITVQDTGPGIPVDMAEQIFGEFNQIEDDMNRQFEGTGLGLAITKQLVELMGGRIWVDTEVDSGASFRIDVTLPSHATQGEKLRLPDWVVRVIIYGGPGPFGVVLAKRMRALGAEVVDISSEDLDANPNFQPGDLLIIDRKRDDRAVSTILDTLGAGRVPVPVVVIGHPNGGNVPDPDAGIVHLKKPVGHRTLIRAICAFQEPATPHGTRAPPPAKTLRKLRILAAEDNKTNRLVFSKLVRKLNIELEFAENGQEAVKKWLDFRPDMIFMDISMPVMDGKQATREIRALETTNGTGHTPIIALTAHAMQGDDSDILQAGLDHYLTKPLRKLAIFDQIRAAVADRSEPVFEDLPPVGSETSPSAD